MLKILLRVALEMIRRHYPKHTSICLIFQSYEYGIGQGPGQEAHGGSTYCAVASLALLDKVHECFSPKEVPIPLF